MPIRSPNFDLNHHQLLNAALENRDTPPANPVMGQAYFDTVLDGAYLFTASGWHRLDNTATTLLNVRHVTASGVLTAVDDLVLVDASSGNLTLTLPSAATSGRQLEVKKVDTSSNTVTLLPDASDGLGSRIDTFPSAVIRAALTGLTVAADSTHWWIT